MKNVKKSAMPINTVLGGAVCVLSACLVKCRTMMILVNEVIMMIKVGAMAINVRITKIRSAPVTLPLPLPYVIVTVLAIFISARSSAFSAVPGALSFVR